MWLVTPSMIVFDTRPSVNNHNNVLLKLSRQQNLSLLFADKNVKIPYNNFIPTFDFSLFQNKVNEHVVQRSNTITRFHKLLTVFIYFFYLISLEK